MLVGYAIEPLDPRLDRTGFACGTPPLDRYFHQFVTQDIRRHVANCFVARSADGAIAAYYTLAATGVPSSDLPIAEAKRLPRYPMLPAALIGRLAVDHRFQGQGLGGALIIDAAQRASAAEPAVYALVTDAKDEVAARFYEHLGFRRFASRPLTLFLPIATALRAFRP